MLWTQCPHTHSSLLTALPPSPYTHMKQPLQLLPYHPTNFNSFHIIAAGTLCTACVDCFTCLSAPSSFLLECPLLYLKASVQLLPIRTPYAFPITTPTTSIFTTPSQLVPRAALFLDHPLLQMNVYNTHYYTCNDKGLKTGFAKNMFKEHKKKYWLHHWMCYDTKLKTCFCPEHPLLQLKVHHLALNSECKPVQEYKQALG